MARPSIRSSSPAAQAPRSGHPTTRRSHHRTPAALVALLLAAASPHLLAQSIVTVAGGGNDEGLPASNVAMDPVGMTYDARGNLVYADQLNSRVRVIDATTGIVRTLAGTGSGVTPVSGAGLVSAVVTTIDNRTGDTRNAFLAPSGGIGGSGIGIGR